MGHVLGVGGVFFRAADPDAVIAWYKDNLDLDIGGGAVWMQEAGPTVYAPFEADTDYFGDAGRQFMVNLRVRDLDGLVKKLTANGVPVRRDPAWDSPGVGRFARIHDPAGTPIELWEPPPGAAR